GDKARLEATVKSFSAFLDELAREVDALAKQPDKQGLLQRTRLFLARSYAGLGQHAKAARLYGDIPVPAKDAEPAEVQNYWAMRILYARELRLAKQFPEARKALYQITVNPQAKQKLLAEVEEIYLLEDEGKFGAAVTRWNKLLSNRALAD